MRSIFLGRGNSLMLSHGTLTNQITKQLCFTQCIPPYLLYRLHNNCNSLPEDKQLSCKEWAQKGEAPKVANQLAHRSLWNLRHHHSVTNHPPSGMSRGHCLSVYRTAHVRPVAEFTVGFSPPPWRYSLIWSAKNQSIRIWKIAYASLQTTQRNI